MKNLIRLASVLILLSAFSCKAGKSQSKAQVQSNEIISIQWGKSFGMCRGYCYTENTYRPDSLILFRKGWQQEENPPIREAEAMSQEVWAIYADLVNLDSFFVLPETIGCPDCADGGAEWVQIQTAARTHKVMFEYGSSQANIEPLLTMLRANDH